MIYNPRQTVLVSCRGVFHHLGRNEEIEDIFPLDWHSPASEVPKKYLILVSKKAPALTLIQNSRAFVVNFMPFSHVDHIVKAGMLHGAFHDKFTATGLQKAECEHLPDTPRIKDAAAWLECRVEGEFDFGDHVLFLGEILHEEETSTDAKRPFHIDGTMFTTTRD
jgi:flavin reductase (DIM6/NTAB) family NADH-FMN oxidoreductase RutF